MPSAGAATAHREEGPVYKHILLPTDGSELSAAAARAGIQLARALGARVSALHVTPPFTASDMPPAAFAAEVHDHEARAKESARRALGAIEAAASAAGVACTVFHRESYSPYEAIIALAGEAECDLICMASHGRRGVAALLLGSETSKVLTHSKIPVLVTR
jgi:nucleotide-binding universal stress UspA family protein